LTRHHRRRPSSRLRETSMQGNPILNSLRTAEAAGYPALLIVSAVCLGLVVGPVMLLGLTDAGWVLGLAVLYLIVAIVVLSVAVGAALSDGDEPDAEGQAPGSRASDERNPSERPSSADPQPGTSAGIGGSGACSQPSRSLGAGRRPSAVPAAVAHAPAAGAPARCAPASATHTPDSRPSPKLNPRVARDAFGAPGAPAIPERATLAPEAL
jgi:hypothetical protein